MLSERKREALGAFKAGVEKPEGNSDEFPPGRGFA
jgi:hypothetical protein